ncbi:hypothetical protein SOASR032_00020 [Pragia fontium]|uniref:Toxin CdiA n=1 Tax=Pragia fontium TaxID=82985 RepID=A0ABQ5LFI1_9GAMM|nr:hypothetical protein SOASR032_00020 [Pragia fontium]
MFFNCTNKVKELTEGPETKDKVFNAIAHAIVGAAYFNAGCGLPGAASTICQAYSASGGPNPIDGKVPTDGERSMWALNAALNTVGGAAILKPGKGTINTSTLNPNEVRLSQNTVSYNKTDSSDWTKIYIRRSCSQHEKRWLER